MYLLNDVPFEAFCTVPNVFTEEEVEKIRSYQIETTSGLVGNSEVVKEIRDSQIQWLTPTEENVWVFERLSSVIKQVNESYFHLDLRGFESLQLTEYDGECSGHYGAHVDCGYGISPMKWRKLSLSVQLSKPDEYEGGDLVLYPDSFKQPRVIEKELGCVALFRSHVIHEVTPVTKGKRLSLVTWVQGPLLK